MYHEQALQKSLTVPWKLDVCHSGEECWCRLICTAEEIEYLGESEEPAKLDTIADWGSIGKETAEYIVDLHNKSLKKESIVLEKIPTSSIHQNYEEARRYSLTVPWKIDVCNSGEECWCRLILPTEEIQYTYKYSSGQESIQEIEYIVGDGSIEKIIAEYIVNLHNEYIEKFCT